VADGWCWFVLREEYYWLVAGGWFVLREKYCWRVADKPSEAVGHVLLPACARDQWPAGFPSSIHPSEWGYEKANLVPHPTKEKGETK
jgi:hypothetical protein